MFGIQAAVQLEGISQPDIQSAGQPDSGDQGRMERQAAQAQQQRREIFLCLKILQRLPVQFRFQPALPDTKEEQGQRGREQQPAENG